MATTTAPAIVKNPCGRCDGTGHYGGNVAGGVCFNCEGRGYTSTTQAKIDAAKTQQARRDALYKANIGNRVAELKRRETLVRLALDDLDDALNGETGDINTQDARRFPAHTALMYGTTEDTEWAKGDGVGIDWTRELWIRNLNNFHR